VDKIVDAGIVDDQATMICAVIDHPALVAARALAGILVICMSSHSMPQTIGAYCDGVTKGQMIGKYSN
jgi:hypothetical protein